MLSLIAPFWQSFDDKGLTYKVPEKFQSILWLWHIVKVPIWSKSTYWVVIDISKQSPSTEDNEKIKEIEYVYDFLQLWLLQVFLIRSIAVNYFVAIHKSTSLFFSKFSQEKLQKEKFILETKPKKYEFYFEKKLSEKQEKVLGEILKSKYNMNLLRGVTGSGKTEIYIKILQQNLLEGKQWLLLIPEIILWSQIVERLKQVFWEDVIFINSGLTEKEKYEIWKSIYLWEAKIIVWTRSSLFYPYKNLWYIIQDEEHDRSYRSENSPRYKIGEILESLANNFDISILVASWTPLVTTIYKAKIKKDIWYFSLLWEYGKKENL